MTEDELLEIEERISLQAGRREAIAAHSSAEFPFWFDAVKLLYEVRRLRSLVEGITRWDG